MLALPWTVEHAQKLSGVRALRPSFESPDANELQAFVNNTVNGELKLIFHSRIQLRPEQIVEIGPKGDMLPFRVLGECSKAEYEANYGKAAPPGFYYEMSTD